MPTFMPLAQIFYLTYINGQIKHKHLNIRPESPISILYLLLKLLFSLTILENFCTLIAIFYFMDKTLILVIFHTMVF